MSVKMALNQENKPHSPAYMNIRGSPKGESQQSAARVVASAKRYDTSQEPPYQNMPSSNMDQITASLSNFRIGSDSPQPADRGQNVAKVIRRKTEEEEKKKEFAPRTPIGCLPSDAHQREQQQLYVNLNRPQQNVHSGSKRRPNDYQNVTPDPSALQKAMKPQPSMFDRQREDMMMRNSGFSGNRLPVEHTDPSATLDYYNDSMRRQQQADNSIYHNISAYPQHSASMTVKAPISTPRHDTSALAVLGPIETGEILSHYSQHSNSHADVPSTSHQYNPTAYQHTGEHRMGLEPATPLYYQHMYPNEQPAQCYPNPASSGRQAYYGHGEPVNARPNYSPSQSPRAHPGSFSNPNSPASQSCYSQSSPHGYSQQSPNHTAFSPAGYQPPFSPDAPMMHPAGSPANSSNVPSPYSTTTNASSPSDQSMYAADNEKLPDIMGNQDYHNSLHDALLDISPEIFQQIPSTSSYPTTTTHSAPSYDRNPYTLYAPENLDDVYKRPVAEVVGQERPSYPPSHQGVSAISTGLAPKPLDPSIVAAALQSGKLPIPQLPKAATNVLAPGSIMLVVLPSDAQPVTPKANYRAIAPKKEEGETATTTPKSKNKKAAKSTKPKGAARGQPDPKKEVIAVNAMIATSTDERLLSKTGEGDESVLHKAIAQRKQAVIVAIFQAIKNRPALQPLIDMANGKGQTPLFMSVLTGQSWLTDVLVNKMNANCDALCKYESCDGHVEYLTPLHYASKHGDRCLKELQIILASRTTTVDKQSGSGMTALHLALWNNGQLDTKSKKPIDSRAVIKCLLEAGADCHITDNKNGKTALHFAVENGSLDLTRIVLESKGHSSRLIDLPNYDLRTALHFAVLLRTISEENKIDLVRYLINKGANKNSKDKNRLTPKELVQLTEVKMLAVFNESMSPASTYSTSDDDSYTCTY